MSQDHLRDPQAPIEPEAHLAPPPGIPDDCEFRWFGEASRERGKLYLAEWFHVTTDGTREVWATLREDGRWELSSRAEVCLS